MDHKMFTDVVNGNTRLIMIIDSPDEETMRRFFTFFEESKASPLPATEPTQAERSLERPDTVWGSDNDAIMYKAMAERFAKELHVPKDADKKWFYGALMSDTARKVLNNVDGMFLYFKSHPVSREFYQAAGPLVAKIASTSSVTEDCAKSLMCMQHICEPLFEKIRSQSHAVSFGEWFGKQTPEKQSECLQYALKWVVANMNAAGKE